jgi:hypothetical protein
MDNYLLKVTQNKSGEFYAKVVFEDENGNESIASNYRPRHFATKEAAYKSFIAWQIKNKKTKSQDKNPRNFSKEILIKRIWHEISGICDEYSLSWAKGSSQVAGASQDTIEAYGEILGLMRVIEIIQEKRYTTN